MHATSIPRAGDEPSPMCPSTTRARVSAVVALLLGAVVGCSSDAQSLSNPTGNGSPGNGDPPAGAAPGGVSAPGATAPNGTATPSTGTPGSEATPGAGTPLSGGEPPGAEPPGTQPPGAEPPSTPPPGTEPPVGSDPLATCNIEGGPTATTPTVWVIGDSTASEYAPDLYPRMGWAQPLQEYFGPACAVTRDMARSGRSSKSFFDEGAWTPVRDALKSGDFVLIQFGHNDEKIEDPLRGTDPFTTFQQYLTTFIDDTLARQATPVLMTPIHRNQWNGLTVRDTHGNYSVAIRQLAELQQVALIDASTLTQSHFEAIGPAATTALFMDLAAGQFPNYPAGNSDQTHLQDVGAHAVAELILADAARQRLPFGQLVKMIVASPLVATGAQ